MYVTPRDNEIELAAGRIPGGVLIIKSGRNTDIDSASTPEDIWDGGGIYTGFPTGDAETLSIVSSSTNDTSAGSGARTLQIFGLNSEWLPIIETVTLNGTTPVTTSNTFRRVTRATVRTSGSSNTAFNAGTLTINHSTTTANIFAVIPVGTNQNQFAGYTIPANKTGFLAHLHVSLSKSNAANIQFAIWIREFGQAPRFGYTFSASDVVDHDRNFYGGITLPARTDLVIRAVTASVNNLDVTAAFDLILLNV